MGRDGSDHQYHRRLGGDLNGTTIVDSEEWIHLGLTVTDDTTTLYLNGQVEASRTYATPLKMIFGRGCIGAYRNNDDAQREFEGQMDHVRIYNRAVSPEGMLWLAGRREPLHKPFGNGSDSAVNAASRKALGLVKRVQAIRSDRSGTVPSLGQLEKRGRSMIQVHMRPVMVVLSFCAVLFAGLAGGRAATSHDRMECWDIFEVTLTGPSSGNPFVDVRLKARFSQGDRAFTPEG